MKNILICLFLLVAIQLNGQVLNRANGSFNLIVNDSLVSGMYYVTGLYNDFTMEYAGTDITAGAYLWTNTCKRYEVDSVIVAPGTTSGVMKLRLADPDAYGTPAGGIGAVMMETDVFLFPLTTSNISENLQSCIQTHFAVKTDSKTIPEFDWKVASTNIVIAAYASTYGANMFVAVGVLAGGSHDIVYSSDGANWTGIAAPQANTWSAVTYGRGKFVAVAPNGTNRVMHSNDGKEWVLADAAEANAWQHVTYGNGRFVAVSSGGTNRAMYSDNGIDWFSGTGLPLNSFQSVTYGKNLFVAVSSSGTNRIAYSTNGESWTSVAAPGTQSWQSVTYGNGRFVAISSSGSSMSSTNGTSWSASTSLSTIAGNFWNEVIFGDGKFIACNTTNPGSNLAYSKDGITWYKIDYPDNGVGSDGFTTVAFGKGRFVIVPLGGTEIYSGDIWDAMDPNENIKQGDHIINGSLLIQEAINGGATLTNNGIFQNYGSIYLDSIFTRDEYLRDPQSARFNSRSYIRGGSSGPSSIPFYINLNDVRTDTTFITINRPLEVLRNDLILANNNIAIATLGASGTSAVETNRARLPVNDSIRMTNLVISQSVALFENPTSRFNGISEYGEVLLNRSAFVTPDTSFHQNIGAAFGHVIDMAHTTNPSSRKVGTKNLGLYITKGTRSSNFEYVQYEPTAPDGDWLVYSELPWASRLDSLGLGVEPTEKFEVDGVTKTNGFRAAIVTVTSNTLISKANHTILVDATSGSIDLTLPDPAFASGSMYYIKKIDNSVNAVTINVSGAETIDGAGDYQMTVQYKYVTLQSDGTNWYILANN
jgi:hypothetical protein